MVEFWKIITELGNIVTIGALVTISAVALHKKNKLYSSVLFIIFFAEELTTYVLKYLIAKPRPLNPLILENGYSFPSGHSTRAAAILLLLALILGKQNSRLRIIYLVVAGTVIGLVGLSRYFLGVHFPIDVIAGVIIGSLWALLGYFILQNKK